ncbi:MAG: NADH-quinone oxidoreductase subunit [Myxococcaceae bacterium]|nr:NADH-quinone oxidoreductase subunit [Myxococcaceae bacterium]
MDQLSLYFDKTILSWLVGLPFLGCFALLFTPRQSVKTIRALSIGVMLFEFVVSLHLLTGDYSSGTYQYVASYELVPAYGIAYTVGIDGISLWLILLTTLMTPIALYASWTSVDTKVKEFALCFMFLEVAMVGAFVALDLFLFYVFWELLLVPMYLIIGIWGGKDRIYASVKFFLYTMVGSLLMFVAIIYVATAYHNLAGAYSFDIRKLNEIVLDSDTQLYLFLAFALAFAIKVPMFPLHTWLPDAHVQAPTGGSVILAAVLLKMGTYGFVRFAMPLFPLASHRSGPTLCVLAVIGIMYGAYCAWVQKDVKKLVAYSSVSHLGFVMLGLFSVTRQGVGGAVLQMVNHGVSTGALFLLVGVIYERRHTRQLSEFGGLAKVMPLYTLLFVIVTMSSVGLPGTNGFIGEFLVLIGAFRTFPILAVIAATSVIIAAAYLLWAIQRILFNALDKTENEHVSDLNRRELALMLPLLAGIIWLGVYPAPVLRRMQPAAEQFVRIVETRASMATADAAARSAR